MSDAALFAQIDAVVDGPVFGQLQAAKSSVLAPLLTALTTFHRSHCDAYDAMCRAYDEPPPMSVQLFKSHELRSVPAADITSTLTSSGTTGQVPSRIFLDATTAARQTKALTNIIGDVLGPQRLPLLIWDAESTLAHRTRFSARAAGVLGMMRFGTRPVFALNDDLSPNREAIDAFLNKFGSTTFFMFGFTFVVWNALKSLGGRSLDLSNGILLHSGGWKKMLAEAVDNATFKSELAARTGITRVTNFYGMVEQVGSIFLEDENGHLSPPAFADVAILDVRTLNELPVGAPGLIQVSSLLPTSYPGHRLLTEDIGVLRGIDTSRRKGKAFEILGRASRAELRGCSDVIASRLP